MSGIDRRSAAFLHEMGIGPLWSCAARDAEPAAAAPVQAEADSRSCASASALQRRSISCRRRRRRIRRFRLGRRAGRATRHRGRNRAHGLGRAATRPSPAAPAAACARAAASRCTATARDARWMVAAGATTAADEKERQPLAGDPGKLLANMLAAVRPVARRRRLRHQPDQVPPATASGGDRAPTADEAAACRPFARARAGADRRRHGAHARPDRRQRPAGQAAAGAAGRLARRRSMPSNGVPTGRHAAPGRTAAARRRQGAGLGRPVPGARARWPPRLTPTRRASRAAGATCATRTCARWPGCSIRPTCSIPHDPHWEGKIASLRPDDAASGAWLAQARRRPVRAATPRWASAPTRALACTPKS